MSHALRVADYLGHILQAIERIQRYTSALDEEAFLQSELVQDAVIRNIEIVGEASNNIQQAAPDWASAHGDVPWLVMYTMRNRVAHAYHKVDLEIVWRTVRNDLPPLQTRLQALLAEFTPAADGAAPA